MYFKFLKTLIVFISLITLVGCAQIVPLNYYPQPQAAETVKTKNTLNVGQITDARGTDPSLIYVADTVGTYGEIERIPYSTNQPMVFIVSTGISTALQNANYRIVQSNPNMTLSGELVSIDTQMMPGGILTTNYKTTIKMNLRLVNNKNGYIVWNQLLMGSSIVNAGFGVSAKWVQTAFNQAMDNLITQLLTSPTFLNSLQH